MSTTYTQGRIQPVRLCHGQLFTGTMSWEATQGTLLFFRLPTYLRAKELKATAFTIAHVTQNKI